MKTMCHCGKPLHYTDPKAREMADKLVAEMGEYITIQVGLRKWLVQRHYILLHGVTGSQLPHLGFPEIGPETLVTRQ